MPTEKLRYLYKNRGPFAPLEFKELKKHLHQFKHEHLVELLWASAQRDDVLRKALMANISIQLAHGDWEKTKAAIDYAFHFPDYVHYNDSNQGLILDEIINTLEILKNQVSREFITRASQYILERGQQLIETFEDGWDWILSLESLEKWIKNQCDMSSEINSD